MSNVKQVKKKHIKYKDCNSTIAQLISAEEMAALYNLKAQIERRNKRAERHNQMLKHK